MIERFVLYGSSTSKPPRNKKRDKLMSGNFAVVIEWKFSLNKDVVW